MQGALEITRIPTFPKLGWYARFDPDTGVCSVEVGPQVEVDPAPAPRWIAAGMWSGDFGKGGFHEAEHMFGSGLRLDADALHLVPASSTVDRCVYAREGRVWHLSNSLVVLLGRLGGRIDLNRDHREWGESMALGVYNYLRQFFVVHPTIPVFNQLIFETLRVSGEGTPSFHFRDKRRSFADYADYFGQFKGEIEELWKNATDPRRARPMRAVTSASRGYDSGAVTAIAAELVPGLTSWTAKRSNTRLPQFIQGLMKVDASDDDGSSLALKLGATPRYLNLDYSKVPLELEAWCWATAQISSELAFHSLLEEADGHHVPTVFFAGHIGDGVWDCKLSGGGLTRQILRGAQSGYALIEARNRYGVIEFSAPYLFARSTPEILKVSRSAEMQPWTLGTDYDRPIARRIMEERGVPREAFGWSKKAVANDLESPQGEALREVFFDQTRWTAAAEQLYRGVNLGLYFAMRGADYVKTRGSRAKLTTSAARRSGKRTLAAVADLQLQTFFVCTHLLAEKYAPQR